jgi:hypothetical protein
VRRPLFVLSSSLVPLKHTFITSEIGLTASYSSLVETRKNGGIREQGFVVPLLDICLICILSLDRWERESYSPLDRMVGLPLASKHPQ